jgi:hypothetical protein
VRAVNASVDTSSAVAENSATARHSVWSGALSVLATGAAIFGAGAATAFPVSTISQDVRLAS